MKVVFLGTNGWYSTRMGNTSCILVDADKYYLVLDAGDGIYKLDQYINTKKSIHLFLSHVHLDHIIGLHQFGRFKFTQKICIYGYARIRDDLQIIRHPYTAPFSDLPLHIEINSLQEGRHQSPFPLTCRYLVHADPCLGYRFEVDDLIIAYCSDTGICDALYTLAEGTDLLITECSFKTIPEECRWPHLKPADAAMVAKKMKVKQLVLTHFDANCYRTPQDRNEAATIAKRIFPNTIAAYDGLELMI